MKSTNYTIILLILLTQQISVAADLVFIKGSDNYTYLDKQINLACDFYGINVIRIDMSEKSSETNLFKAIDTVWLHGIIISSDALSKVNKSKLLAEISKIEQKPIPFLIMGLSLISDTLVLSQWLNGKKITIKSPKTIQTKGNYNVADMKNICFEISGLMFPFTEDHLPREYSLHLNCEDFREIITITDSTNTTQHTIFTRTHIENRDFFFQPGLVLDSTKNNGTNWQFSRKRFFEIAPLFMYLKYAFGEYCWHVPADYANFTIDDPWLIEPYGSLHFGNLLKEMEKVNFHTTIAFIPWNYDRNKQAVIELFKQKPNYYSLCIHGNNHDHREFTCYSKKPLNIHENNIRQALARMEEMSKQTGLSYDKVMSFPHNISPAMTLKLLKKYNFLATLNSRNIPMDVEKPNFRDHYLRAVTVKYENFPSLLRYGARINPFKYDQYRIAIDLFLENPVLCFTHHDFFRNGINAFNATANIINILQPKIKWTNLGDISQHLYLKRKRKDNNYDILSYVGNSIIENNSCDSLVYHVKKVEAFNVPIENVTSDLKTLNFRKDNTYISFNVIIPPFNKRNIIIEYQNDLNLDSISIKKSDLRIYLLRRFSDFRDITLEKTPTRRMIVNIYNTLGFKKFSLIILVCIFFISFFFIFAVLRIITKRKEEGSKK